MLQQEIIGILEDTSKGNVIFVSGWDGYGASAALKAVAQRLKSSKSKFDRVVHVDCSLWKSMRALQKAVAEELELPPSMMAIFDQQDEEDDFSGIDEGSRGVIPDFRTEIFRKLVNSRFVVIFHNGSDKCIDLCESCGIPVIPTLNNILNSKVLWTWGGRFRPNISVENNKQSDMNRHTDVVISFSHKALLEEFKEVAIYIDIPEPFMNHIIVEKCFQYFAYFCEYMWRRHASNYLVCDGIIQGQGNTSAWEVANALQRNIHSDCLLESTCDDIGHPLQCNLHNSPYFYSCESIDRWVLVNHVGRGIPDKTGMLLSNATSFFVLPVRYSRWMTRLPDGIFQQSKLRVLHLSRCRFSFESPPFRCCSQLRFLQLVECRNIPSDKHPGHNEDMSCFQKLWVLHLRRTNWYQLLSEEMMNFMVELRELNVEEVEDWNISDLRCRGPSLVKVHIQEDYFTYRKYHLPDLSSARFLKTVILVDCFKLKQVVPGMLPPSLESFTFRFQYSYYPVNSNISSISLRGCCQLKSILLEGDLLTLQELDLSGTKVKTLNLSSLGAPNLKRLILLACEKLCAMLWPPENKRAKVLELLHIDTTRSTSLGSSSILAATATEQDISRHEFFGINWYISARDIRILRLLKPVKKYIEEYSYVYMEMDSSPTSSATVGDTEVAQGIRSRCQPNNYPYARDVFFQSDLQAGAGNEGSVSWMWDCPASPTPRAPDLYVHIQDKQEVKRGLLQQKQSKIEGINTSAVLLPSLIVDNARMLHVHDSSSITRITCPQGSYWWCLEWCRVERCPELRTVFSTRQQSEDDNFCDELATFWASELPKARYIWEWSAMRMFSSVHMAVLHLDYCPRLIHVLPLSDSVDTLPHLDTLEIVCCGDLREVFALDPKQKHQRIIGCPKLRRIHLYELPSLQHICGSRMSAPNLETVKIRGCWSLRSLPAVSRSNEKLPSVDCEKDWWDNLEWDGVEANHHPSLYEHNHSSHYKAQHQRGTVLR